MPDMFSLLESVLRSAIDVERPASTPPSARRLRFVEPGPSYIHVYESAPSSPRRVLGLLPPPDPDNIDTNTPKLIFHPRPRSHHQIGGESTKEGTPESIRQKFFPDETSHRPALDWMRESESERAKPIADDQTVSPTRFDLSGRIVGDAQAHGLPTHLGLHHHSDPSQRAGYTYDDLIHLSRSTATSQRSMILTVLARVLQNQESRNTLTEAQVNAIVASGLEAMSSRGGLRVSASGVGVFWAALCW